MSGLYLRRRWTPANISTALWLDAADSSTITTVSGAISQWNDKSGNGRNASQGTAAARPTLSSAALNGRNVATFDGTDDKLTISSSFLATNTLLIIAAIKENNGSWGALISSKNNGADASPAFGFNYFYNKYEYVPGNTQLYSTTGFGSWGIIAGQSTASNSHSIIINGTTEATSSFNVTISQTNASTVLGEYRVGDGNIGGFDLAEIIVLTSNINGTNRQRIEGYLAHKWGLVSNLPVSHPFKNYPPRGI
jgi:hypothetical protein